MPAVAGGALAERIERLNSTELLCRNYHGGYAAVRRLVRVMRVNWNAKSPQAPFLIADPAASRLEIPFASGAQLLRHAANQSNHSKPDSRTVLARGTNALTRAYG